MYKPESQSRIVHEGSMAAKLNFVAALVLVRALLAVVYLPDALAISPLTCSQVNVCKITARSPAGLHFEPACLPLVALVANQSETLQHELLLRNFGTRTVDVQVVAQCDNDLR